MSSNFQYYREAARSLSSGWLQWDWFNGSGENCLVQVLRDATRDYELSRSMIAELDGELDSFKDYRLLRMACRLKGESLEVAFALWNDLPWRRKKDVLGVLTRLADQQEAEWETTERQRIIAEQEAEQARITAERDRLDTEVKELAPKVKELEARVQELENENSILKRLTNSATLRNDRRTLEQLSDELDSRYEAIEELSEVA